MTERDDIIHETHETSVVTAFEGAVPVDTRQPSPIRRFSSRYAPAVAAFFTVIIVWEGLTRLFSVQSFILPKPSEIITSFVETSSTIWGAGFNTLIEAASGFLLGTTLAVATSLAAARWVGFREGMLPMAIALNATPIAALAPIFNNWFGLTNPFSKTGVVAVVVYFPVMINTTRGLLEADPAELELMRSLAAPPTEVMRRVRIPNALPYFFASMKVATALSLIAAIIAEYFGGPQDVLGQYIVNRAQLFQFPDAWAAILVASLIGLTFYALILVAERIFMPWHVSMRRS
ncbi:MAG TPA: ABC transporter permease [Acidimicrobiia bacterium]|nr:ABC transporter permease [Acidimicrobiia bacterium]